LAVAARGAGTSAAGLFAENTLLLDLSRHLREISAPSSGTVHVQAGAVLGRVNARVREQHRVFPPDSPREHLTTIGGLIGVDACGSRSLRYGRTRDHLASVEVVLADGSIRTLRAGEAAELPRRNPTSASDADVAGREPSGESASSGDPHLTARLSHFWSQVAQERSERALDEAQGRSTPSGRTWSETGLAGTETDAQRFPAGTDGSLAVVTGATLHTLPIPAARGVVLALFPRLIDAVHAATRLADLEPSACDLLDRRLLSLAREVDDRFFRDIPVIAEAALLVEHTAGDSDACRDRIDLIRQALSDRELRALRVVSALDNAEVDFLWSLPGRTLPRLAGPHSRERPVPFADDLVVPVPAIPDFLLGVQQVFQQHRVSSTLYGHPVEGRFSIQPLLDPRSPEFDSAIERLTDGLGELMDRFGARLGRHLGRGVFRSRFLVSRDEGISRWVGRLKGTFDPTGVFGPVPVPTHPREERDGRRGARVAAAEDGPPLNLRWTLPQVVEQASGCHGCGECRTQSAELRMCPFFRIEPSESASPRAKANLLRGLGTGAVRREDLVGSVAKELTSTCFNCKQCDAECPSKLPISRMMTEARAMQVAEHGLKASDWVLSRAHSWGGLGAATSMFSNWLIKTPSARWVIERVLGIARKRKLPEFARRPFVASAPREWRTRPGLDRRDRTVVLYVDHYVNYHDPALGRACVALLNHLGWDVYLPPDQRPSGMAMISAGDLDGARDFALANLRALGEWAREGYRIVCVEPTSVVCFRTEYPYLVDHPDVEPLARQAIELGAFLRDLDRHGKLPKDFRPLDLDLGYHTPCHLKALQGGTPFAELLEGVPGVRLRRLDHGCSGMAGAFGLTRENFATSLRIGWPLITRMRTGDLTAGTTECSACKLQMEQGTPTPTLHPALVLAWAYGLSDETRDRLHRPRAPLIVS
jgi:Fe-S oxidoreductase/FAD/FMN-containing dehydrogenase